MKITTTCWLVLLAALSLQGVRTYRADALLSRQRVEVRTLLEADAELRAANQRLMESSRTLERSMEELMTADAKLKAACVRLQKACGR